MSIKKIINPEEFSHVWNDLEIYFREENKTYGHRYLPISKQSVVDSWGHAALLNNTMHVWADIEEEKARGVIMFLEHMHPTFGKKIFTEYFWLSNNPKKSFSLFKIALSFAKKRGIKYAAVSCVENYPTSERLKKIYQKMGFHKDTETFIKKL
jgi:hypothetical protein